MAYKAFTQNHFDLYEVVSALQKEIRRGNEKEAVYWAYELCPRYETYLWRRLIVILHEDIGIANPSLFEIVPRNRELFFELRSTHGQNGIARLVLVNTVLLMCRSLKSRIAGHLAVTVEQERKHSMDLEIPDYALDQHTHRGKQKGRGLEHFLKEGAILKPRATSEQVDDPYEKTARKWWLGGEFIKGDPWGGSKAGKKSKNQEEEEDELQTSMFDE